ncbi:MAG: hypothetical protein LQ351_004945 [Letrouitia transgressa]|nr:MAG: hypothetical protein LQ351_004945 [Letrouitia transgressa]
MRGSKFIERPLTATSKISPVLPPLDLPSISLAFLDPDPSEESSQNNAIEHDSIDEEVLDQREVDQEQLNYEGLNHDLVIQALLTQEQLDHTSLDQNRLSQGYPNTQQLHHAQAEHAQINRAQTVQVELDHQQLGQEEFKEKLHGQEHLDEEKRNRKDVQQPDTDLEMHGEASTQEIDLHWKAGRQEWLILAVLVIISLMAALDATVLVPVLPVSFEPTDKLSQLINL